MIRTVNLTKRYGSLLAVDGIDLTIEPGEIYGFLGPNGAGKTSTIKMILGITRPTAGEVFLFGERYHSGRRDLRTRIGVVPELHPRGVWSWMTAREYLRMFGELYGVHKVDERIADLLSRVGLIDVADRKYTKFSRGMTQKLSFVRALLHDPDILVLDEPISGLDPVGVREIRDLILAERREGRTIVISSHILSEMEKVCTRVAVIHRGRLCAQDTMENLLVNLTDDRQYRVELDQVPDWLVEEIRSCDFVRDATRQGSALVVHVAKLGDHRRELSSYLYAKRLIPLTIHEQSASLEEAFLTITNDTIGRISAAGEQR